jgi:hypothetical protein
MQYPARLLAVGPANAASEDALVHLSAFKVHMSLIELAVGQLMQLIQLLQVLLLILLDSNILLDS